MGLSISSFTEGDEDVQQTAKLRHMNIKPLGESKGAINASVDELRDAVGNIIIQPTAFSRSSTFDGVSSPSVVANVSLKIVI